MREHLSSEELIDHHYGGEAVDLDHLRSCGPCSELSDRLARERSALKDACLSREAEPAGLVRQFPAMRFGAAAVGFCAVLITILWTARETPPEPAPADPPASPVAIPPPGQDEPKKEEQVEDAVVSWLRWFLRHQAADGSWGRMPQECRCPLGGAAPGTSRDADIEKKARGLIPVLGQEDPAERERATAALKKLGEAIEPVLKEAAAGSDPEIRARAGDLLREFARGRESPDVEATGLSLLPYLIGGYSHLSKDKYDGLCAGDSVRKALQWLMSRQTPDGAIGVAPREGLNAGNALAALALSEAYGLTGSNLFKDEAQKAVDFVCGRQRESGAWGPGRDELRATMWSVEVVHSAVISGLSIRGGKLDTAVEWLRKASEAGGPESACYLHATGLAAGAGNLKQPLKEGTIRIPFEKPEARRAIERVIALRPSELNPFDCYVSTYALFFVDGPSGPLWKSWNEKMKNALVYTQKLRKDGCSNGSWDPRDLASGAGGRLSATGLNTLTLQVYYRYANIFGQK